MLAGGAEAPLAPLCFGAFAIIRAMSTRNDDPTAASRRSTGTGRLCDGKRGRGGGARGTLRALARGGTGLRRGHRIWYHQRRAPHDGAAPRWPAGPLAPCGWRWRRRKLSPGEIGYINAHGSSTPLNDPTENGASARSSATWPRRSPSVEPRVTTATRWARVAPSRPPSARWRANANGSLRRSTCRRPTRPVTSATWRGREPRRDPEYMLSNSFGFGGINACLVFRRVDGR